MSDSAIVENGSAARLSSRVLASLRLPAERWRTPVLISLLGLPATGKTTLARSLAERHPLVVLSTDAIRLTYGLPSGPAAHAVTYPVIGKLLDQGIGVVWDGVHFKKEDRRRVRQFAEEHGARFVLVVTTAYSVVIAERLRERERDPAQVSAEGKFVITPEHFARIARWLEPAEPDEEPWAIDTSGGEDLDQVALLDRYLETLRNRSDVR